MKHSVSSIGLGGLQLGIPCAFYGRISSALQLQHGLSFLVAEAGLTTTSGPFRAPCTDR